MPQASLFTVFRVKNYFSFLPVNNKVILLKLIYFKDNRVVSKWCDIDPKLFLVPVYIQVELYYIGDFLYSKTIINKL